MHAQIHRCALRLAALQLLDQGGLAGPAGGEQDVGPLDAGETVGAHRSVAGVPITSQRLAVEQSVPGAGDPLAGWRDPSRCFGREPFRALRLHVVSHGGRKPRPLQRRGWVMDGSAFGSQRRAGALFAASPTDVPCLGVGLRR